jgi:hypothetical protein
MAQIVQPVARPPEHVCPISHTVMTDPVVAEDGHTYDREYIETWFNKAERITSPLTGNPIGRTLIPNTTLKKLIQDFAEVKQPPPQKTTTVSHRVESTFTKLSDNEIVLDVAIACATPPTTRAPLRIAVVVDTSLSMDTAAKTPSDTEDHGLSILDITKHSVCTLLSMLGEQDEVQLITFSNDATIRGTYRLDAAGKQLLLQTVRSIRTEGSTNFWAGLHKGMQFFSPNREGPTMHGSVWIFTDGVPNINPPRGIMKMIDTFQQKKEINFSVNTFGFGYALKSTMLHDVATSFGGNYHFIPGPDFVGTVFINAIAHLLAKTASNIEVSVACDGLIPITEPRHCQSNLTTDSIQTYTVAVGDCDGTRHAILRFTGTPTSIPVTVTLVNCYSGKREQFCVSTPESTTVENKQLHRVLFSSALYKSVSLQSWEDATMDTFVQEYQDEYLQAIRNDANGQVREALNQTHFRTWGKHWLLSLARSHQLQRCLNFADPGVQQYGSAQFRVYQDKTDDTFNNQVPAPTPSVKTRHTKPIYRMADSISSTTRGFTGGCFEDAWVTLQSGGECKVSTLKKGDILENGATVVCITEQHVEDVEMVRMQNSVLITPWHPCLVRDSDHVLNHSQSALKAWAMGWPKHHWVFPANQHPSRERYTGIIYNAILRGGTPIIRLNHDVVACTLGHGWTGKKIGHPFFGTSAVVKTLHAIFPNQICTGRVDLTGCTFARDKRGLVHDIIAPRQQRELDNIVEYKRNNVQIEV